MPYAKYTPHEVESRGEEIFARDVRPRIRADQGGYVVIDIETGDFEIADDDLTATKRLLQRRPEGVLYGLRIGHATAYRLGGRFTVAAP